LIPIVLAYKRPELTNRLVARLLEIDSKYESIYESSAFSSILLIHDGLRETEDEASRGFYQETRKLCVDLERANIKVKSITFDTNLGLTEHFFRIINGLEFGLSNYIFFEEDKAPTLQGIVFLNQTRKSMDSAGMVDTLPLHRHLSGKSTQISTLFTDNGNITIGEDLYDRVKHLWSVKDKYQEEFKKNLNVYLRSFISGFALERAQNYYSKYYSWGLTNVDRTDNLFSYALILSKKFKTCPLVPLSENWSDQDNRGKNVNTVPTNRGLECSYATIDLWGYEICPQCEKQGVSERVALGLPGAIRANLLYRLPRIFRKY
jgi:hypothetical protein